MHDVNGRNGVTNSNLLVNINCTSQISTSLIFPNFEIKQICKYSSFILSFHILDCRSSSDRNSRRKIVVQNQIFVRLLLSLSPAVLSTIHCQDYLMGAEMVFWVNNQMFNMSMTGSIVKMYHDRLVKCMGLCSLCNIGWSLVQPGN
jgi:hypothetical protein